MAAKVEKHFMDIKMIHPETFDLYPPWFTHESAVDSGAR